MSAIISALLAMMAILAIFAGVYTVVERPADVAARLQAYALAGVSRKPEEDEGQRGLARWLAALDRFLSGQSLARRIALRLAQANVRATVPEFLLMVVAAGMAGGTLGYALQGHLLSAAAGAVLGLALPWAFIERRRYRRIRAFHDQLIDVLMLIIGSLRSGHGLQNALELASREMGPPASEEFARVLREMGFGLGQTEALNNLVARMETDDLQLVVTAVNISHEVGGSLSLVLEKIAETLRERIRLQGELRVLTTQQRLTSYLLVALPIFLAVVLSLMNPQYMSGFLQPGPTRLIPVGILAMELVGFFLTRRMARIDI